MSEEVKRNCNTCKSGLFARCETLKNNEEYQNIKAEGHFDGMVEKHSFKDSFICDNYKSRYIEYPIEVSKINQDTKRHGFHDGDIGKFVSIRPCGEKYKDKTYLGLYLGDLPIEHHISHNPDTKELNVGFHCNSAIFVFDLKKIIYGCESWWGIIESEKDLKQISNADIDNVWYVKVLKEISKGNEAKKDGI